MGRGEIVPFKDLMDEAVELIYKDALHFNCVDEINHNYTLINNGTGAHRQVHTYTQTLESDGNHGKALRSVVDLLIEETLIGT